MRPAVTFFMGLELQKKTGNKQTREKTSLVDSFVLLDAKAGSTLSKWFFEHFRGYFRMFVYTVIWVASHTNKVLKLSRLS